MRSKRSIILSLVVLLASMMALRQGASAGAPPAKSKVVHKRGTVEAGVEGGCLLVRDTKDYKLYNVLIAKGDKPKAGDEIWFRGSLHDGPSACMEGIAVDVKSWKLLKAAKPEPKPIGLT